MASDPELREYTRIHLPRRGKLKRFCHMWRSGRKNDFPICCVFRLSLETAFLDGKTVPIGKGSYEKRGSFTTFKGNHCVPCGIFHHRNEKSQVYLKSERKGKIRAFIFDWRNGREDHFPICCILRFALESARDDGKILSFEDGYAVKRGVVVRDDGSEFVPCNVFHHKTESFE